MSSRLKSSAAEWKPSTRSNQDIPPSTTNPTFSASNSYGTETNNPNYYETSAPTTSTPSYPSTDLGFDPTSMMMMMNMYQAPPAAAFPTPSMNTNDLMSTLAYPDMMNMMMMMNSQGTGYDMTSSLSTTIPPTQSYVDSTSLIEEQNIQLMEYEMAKNEIEEFLDKNNILDEEERISLFHELMQVRFPEYVIPPSEENEGGENGYEYVDQGMENQPSYGYSSYEPSTPYYGNTTPSSSTVTGSSSTHTTFTTPSPPAAASTPLSNSLQGLLPQGAVASSSYHHDSTRNPSQTAWRGGRGRGRGGRGGY